MTFELQYTDSKTNARAGLITTDHGQIETPIFMPVGTLGTVKGVHLTELKDGIKLVSEDTDYKEVFKVLQAKYKEHYNIK